MNSTINILTGGLPCKHSIYVLKFLKTTSPNPDKSELKIEDCKLNIQYSIENIQSLQDNENIPIQSFCHKMYKYYN